MYMYLLIQLNYVRIRFHGLCNLTSSLHKVLKRIRKAAVICVSREAQFRLHVSSGKDIMVSWAEDPERVLVDKLGHFWRILLSEMNFCHWEPFWVLCIYVSSTPYGTNIWNSQYSEIHSCQSKKVWGLYIFSTGIVKLTTHWSKRP